MSESNDFIINNVSIPYKHFKRLIGEIEIKYNIKILYIPESNYEVSYNDFFIFQYNDLKKYIKLETIKNNEIYIHANFNDL